MRYKITIEYDGSDYVGWQCQIDQPNKSIEELVTNAIKSITNEPIKLNCAGRTDAGVHATAQTADFTLLQEARPFRIMMGANRMLLNTNISITDCQEVQDDFHSRYSAKLRFYEYRILNRRAPSPLRKNCAFHVPTRLDVDAMKESLQYLVGKEYDFSSFRDAKCQALSPIRTIEEINIKVKKDEIIFTISAKSFLHHMVRNIVGTLVQIGQGKINPQDMKTILSAKDRTKSGPNAPAHGLYFQGASYGDECNTFLLLKQNIKRP